MELSWKLTVYRKWDEVDDSGFLSRWLSWLEKAPDAHVFIHPSIVKSWTDVHRKIQDISPLYCIGEYDNTIFFLPLVIWRRNWKNAFVRVIVPAGYSDYDYHDPLITRDVSDAVQKSFWKMITKRVFNDTKLGYDEIDLPGIRMNIADEHWLIDKDVCPYKDLRKYEDFEHFFQDLSRNTRHGIRRQKRMLDELGDVRYHVYKPDEIDEALAAVPKFLKTHSLRWPNAYKAPELYETIIRNAIGYQQLVHFSELRVNSEPISWELGFRYKQKAYTYMGAFVDAYAKYSPGKIHLLSLLEDSIKSGMHVFDHLRGAHAYKEGWSDDKYVIYKYYRRAIGIKNRFKLFSRDVLQSIRSFFMISTTLCIFC
jgi:CelD/BcsL family acetyltransferase involved in cellulose biosynthesis